jgi:DNA-binding response OmpR family regulator
VHQSGFRQSVLVVENEPLLARLLCRALCRAGYSVEVVQSCEAATNIKRSFHVGVLDIELDDGCGIQLARTLLDLGRLRCLVFFTATTDHRIQELARRLGPVVSKRDGLPALIEALAGCASTYGPTRP